MNNRRLKYEERPTLQGVGNNRHARNIRRIVEYISMSGDSANTMDIYYWLNGNTKQGLQMNALVNILAKGPFISIGEESATNGLGVPRRVKIWKLKIDKVVERRDNNE
tara:strand:- start:244 stop:567 length:324 start_codon:yes stop_codon:yes gene_type:complete